MEITKDLESQIIAVQNKNYSGIFTY